MKKLKYDQRGLVPLIVQDARTGAVLSLFYANQKAIQKSMDTGYVWRFSRQSKKLMMKGATSGNVQKIVSIFEDCDADAVLVRVIPEGPACHLGTYSCFGEIEPLTEGPRQDNGKRKPIPD